jgi:predicted nucleotidyltransferase
MDNRRVFTAEDRDAVRQHVLHLARMDVRTVAAAVVGSLAAGTGDADSDVDISVAVADHVTWRRCLMIG